MTSWSQPKPHGIISKEGCIKSALRLVLTANCRLQTRSQKFRRAGRISLANGTGGLSRTRVDWRQSEDSFGSLLHFSFSILRHGTEVSMGVFGPIACRGSDTCGCLWLRNKIGNMLEREEKKAQRRRVGLPACSVGWLMGSSQGRCYQACTAA